MCKFPSFSRDDLCALVPPSLVKKVKGINVLLLLLRKISLSSTSRCRPLWNYNLYKESYIKMPLGTLLPYHLVYLLVWQLHTNRGCNFLFLFFVEKCRFFLPLFQLKYIVPRLSLEARGITCEEGKADLSWSSLSCPSLNYRRASLCLWKQARFQELLKEKAFQVRIFPMP